MGGQYRAFIAELVKLYTSAGIVAILDLHWSDDDAGQAPMATKGASNCIDFWDGVAGNFSNNSMVFYELYNEPHTSVDPWMNGDATTAGMLEMLAAVRKHTANPVVVAGAAAFAYDSASLVQLDAKLKASGERNVIYNFHPCASSTRPSTPLSHRPHSHTRAHTPMRRVHNRPTQHRPPRSRTHTEACTWAAQTWGHRRPAT